MYSRFKRAFSERSLHSRTALAGLLITALPSFSQADTLLDIYELALKNDPQLKAAEATLKAGLESRNIALAALLPQVNGTASRKEFDREVQTTRTLDSGQNIDIAFDTDGDTNTYQVSATQALFDLSAFFNFAAGKKQSEKAKADFAVEQQSLITRVTTAYFNVLRAQENLKATQAEERATKRQLEQTQQRFDVGLIAITDVHESQAAYDSTVARRLENEGQLYTSMEALTQLTDASHGSLWTLNSSFKVTEPVPGNRQNWVDFALKRSPSILSAQFAADSAHSSAKAKAGAHGPKLSASYDWVDQDTEGESSVGFGNPTQAVEEKSFSINLSVPIFAGGGISAQRRQAYHQYNAAVHNRTLTQRRVVQNTKAAFIAVMTDVQRVKARKQAVVSAKSALEATQAGYNVGTRNIVDVLQAQRTLFGAIRDEANARFDYVVDMFKLKQEAGTLSPADIKYIESYLVAPEPAKASDYGV